LERGSNFVANCIENRFPVLDMGVGESEFFRLTKCLIPVQSNNTRVSKAPFLD